MLAASDADKHAPIGHVVLTAQTFTDCETTWGCAVAAGVAPQALGANETFDKVYARPPMTSSRFQFAAEQLADTVCGRLLDGVPAHDGPASAPYSFKVTVPEQACVPLQLHEQV